MWNCQIAGDDLIGPRELKVQTLCPAGLEVAAFRAYNLESSPPTNTSPLSTMGEVLTAQWITGHFGHVAPQLWIRIVDNDGGDVALCRSNVESVI